MKVKNTYYKTLIACLVVCLITINANAGPSTRFFQDDKMGKMDKMEHGKMTKKQKRKMAKMEHGKMDHGKMDKMDK